MTPNRAEAEHYSFKKLYCYNLEGWDGERFKSEGTYVYLWLIYVDVWQKPTQFCKALILQLKDK